MARKLTPKQLLFIDRYIVSLNATQAAIEAGYSAKTARSVGSENLTKPDIAAAIAAAMAKRSARTEVTQDYVLSNLVAIVERSMQRAPVCNSKGEQLQEDGKDLWSYDGKVAVSALTLLGKHQGMFVDRVKLEGGVVVIEDEHWYQNTAHDISRARQGAQPPQGPAAPAANPARPRP